MDKKFWFQLFGLAVVILGATFLTFNYKYLLPLTSQFVKTNVNNSSSVKNTKMLKIAGTDGTVKAQIEVEIADTEAKRAKGLGYRDSLATTSGMLFEHGKTEKFTYWMKGMQFPLDILWISGNKIADIIPNIPIPISGQSDDTLERYSPTVAVDRVLEVNSGFVAQNNIQIGDTITVGP